MKARQHSRCLLITYYVPATVLDGLTLACLQLRHLWGAGLHGSEGVSALHEATWQK